MTSDNPNFDHETAFADAADAARSVAADADVREVAVTSPHLRDAIRYRVQASTGKTDEEMERIAGVLDLRTFLRPDGDIDLPAVDRFSKTITRREAR